MLPPHPPNIVFSISVSPGPQLWWHIQYCPGIIDSIPKKSIAAAQSAVRTKSKNRNEITNEKEGGRISVKNMLIRAMALNREYIFEYFLRTRKGT